MHRLSGKQTDKERAPSGEEYEKHCSGAEFFLTMTAKSVKKKRIMPADLNAEEEEAATV